MRKSVRDLITDACSEARLVNRSQPIPGNIFVDALELFKKRTAQYQNTNLLSFTRKELNFTTDKEITLIGTYVLKDTYVEGTNFFYYTDDLPTAVLGMVAWDKDCTVGKVILVEDVPTWNITTYENRDTAVEQVKDCFETVPDIEVENLQEVVRLYIQPTVGESERWVELPFVAYEDYYNWDYTDKIYSVLPIDDNHIKLFLRKSMLQYKIKLMYNAQFEFDKDSELNIPHQFIALFTAGLVYDLAMQYPRLSDTTVALLKSRLDELEENVRRSSAVNKFIARDTYNRNRVTYEDGLYGRFIGL